MEVDGGEISLTFSGRTRDSGFDLTLNRSDLVCRHNSPRSDLELNHPDTGRGSPPMLDRKGILFHHSVLKHEQKPDTRRQTVPIGGLIY